MVAIACLSWCDCPCSCRRGCCRRRNSDRNGGGSTASLGAVVIQCVVVNAGATGLAVCNTSDGARYVLAVVEYLGELIGTKRRNCCG